jgi:DNA-binding MurR/RpiR family transcriptional regulator
LLQYKKANAVHWLSDASSRFFMGFGGVDNVADFLNFVFLQFVGFGFGGCD